MVQVGNDVRLHTPDNAVLHQQPGKVVELYEWGALVSTDAAATGVFRAAWHEMVRVQVCSVPQGAGYTGDFCETCGGGRMTRNGSCLKCEDCGSTTGCS